MVRRFLESKNYRMIDNNTTEIDELEKSMQSSLQRVAPRPEFVEGLHRRLTDPMTPSVRFTRQYSSQFILLVLASILSGIIFVLTSSRVIISLIREFRLVNYR
jgi:hypothetical protein